MNRFAVRLLLGLLALMLMVFGIRGMMLPAQSAAIFIQYAEGSSWQPATQSPLFDHGQLE